MYENIAKVTYQWGARYWCFTDEYVADVYDEYGGKVERNDGAIRGFDDMSLDELTRICLDRYNLVLYTGDKANELLYQLCTRL